MANVPSHIYRLTMTFVILLGAGAVTGVFSRIQADDCPDAWITAKIKAKLMADDGIGAFKVDVDTEECVVTLSGCVDTRDKIKRAGTIAGSVKKVKSVNNRLVSCPKD